LSIHNPILFGNHAKLYNYKMLCNNSKPFDPSGNTSYYWSNLEMNAFYGRYLKIDLTDETYDVVPLDDKILFTYLGGNAERVLHSSWLVLISGIN